MEAGEADFCKTHIVSRIDNEKFKVNGYILCGEVEKAAILAINSQDLEKTQEILQKYGDQLGKEKAKEIKEIVERLRVEGGKREGL